MPEAPRDGSVSFGVESDDGALRRLLVDVESVAGIFYDKYDRKKCGIEIKREHEQGNKRVLILFKKKDPIELFYFFEVDLYHREFVSRNNVAAICAVTASGALSEKESETLFTEIR